MAAVLLALLGACSSKADRIESGLRKGADYVRLADWAKANLEVRNVLQIDPKNGRAYDLAGQVAEGQHDLQRAFGSYLKAVELDPANVVARTALARIYLLAGELDKAEQTIAAILAQDPGHLGARTLEAALVAKRGKPLEAIAQARALVDSQPVAPVETSLLLAGLYLQQGDAKQALAVVDRALKADSDNLSLLTVAAQIASAQGGDTAMAERAVAFYRRATELSSKDADLWQAWALHHVRRHEIDTAEAVLRNAIKAQPDDDRRRLALLDFLGAQRGLAVAEQAYLAAIADAPKDSHLRFGLAALYRAAKRPGDAERVLKAIVDTSHDEPAGLSARNQLAAAALAAGRSDAARRWLDEVLQRSPRDGDALVMRGRLLLGQGHARDAVIDLRAAARDRPGTAEIAGLLAQAHRAAQEPQLARDVLADAVKFKPDDPNLHMLLAADMADAKDFEAANLELDEAIKRAPMNVRGYEVKAQLAIVQKDIAGAEKALQTLKSQFPDDPLGPMRLGQLYASQKKINAALKEYDLAARRAPPAPGPLVAAIALLSNERRFDEAAERLNAFEQGQPHSATVAPLVAQLRGELALARNDPVAAEEAYRQWIAAAPGSTAAYQGLVRSLMLRKDGAGVLAALDAGEKANPNDVSLPAARAEWLARTGRTDEAIAIYERLLQRAPADDTITNNLAYLLTEVKGDTASLDRALSLTGRFAASDNPSYLDSLGWVRYRLGQYDQAVPVLERAVAMSSNAPLLHLHLGLALHKSGEVKRGNEFLRKALESKTGLPHLEEARQLIARS